MLMQRIRLRLGITLLTFVSLTVFAITTRRFFSSVSTRRDRHPDDGRWYSQVSPFKIDVYSAFYDDRTSLLSGPQVAVIGRFADRVQLTRCLLWFRDHDDSDSEPTVTVPSVVTSFNSDDKLVICRLPEKVFDVPVGVALSWNIGKTDFRVPVEVPRRSDTPGQLVLCLAAVFGDLSPRQVVEWLEMQRLLGVERVVVYNQSMSDAVGRVFIEYRDDDDAFVELRQTQGRLMSNTPYEHQITSMNDCMYRHIGTFRYITFVDLDELIVPRQDFTTIPHLIDHLLLQSANKSVGSFVFRNAHFFTNRTDDDNSNQLRSTGGSFRRPRNQSSSVSTYLTRLHRAAVSPPNFYHKSVVDSRACVAMWVHHYQLFASAFQTPTTRRHEVDERLALKHHYRAECNMDDWPTLYRTPGSCRRELKSATVDDVIRKYSVELTSRLFARGDRLDVRNTTS